MANSPTYTNLLNAVMNLVAEATGIERSNVIPGNDNAPAPNSLYATVLVISIAGEGVDSEVARDASDDTETDLNIKGNRIGSFSVQTYRDGAADAIESLLSFGATSVGQIWLQENSLTWRKASDTRNLDAVMGSKWEERRSVDIELKYTSTKVDTVNSIASTEIIINLTDSIDITETEEVTE